MKPKDCYARLEQAEAKRVRAYTMLIFRREPEKAHMTAVARFAFNVDRFDRLIVESMYVAARHHRITLHEAYQCIMSCRGMRRVWKKQINQVWLAAQKLGDGETSGIDHYQFRVNPMARRRAARLAGTLDGKTGWFAISIAEHQVLSAAGEITLQ